MSFKLMAKGQVKKYIPEMERLEVSKVARNKGGFLNKYLSNDYKDKEDKKRFMQKRNNFIKRHLKQFKKNPTYRRYLALIAWAYNPFNPQRYYPLKFPVNTKEKFNIASKRFKEMQNRTDQSKEAESKIPQGASSDEKRKTKESKYTKYFKDNNLPSDKTKLAELLKKKKNYGRSIKRIREDLSEIFDRGLKAWETNGSRPGANKNQWAYGRLYSFVYHVLEGKEDGLKHDKDILKDLKKYKKK